MTSVVPRTPFFWATHVTEARARGWPPGARGLVTVPSRAVCGEAPGAGGIQSATRDPGLQSCSPSLPDRWFLWGRPAAQVQRATHAGAGGPRCRPRGRRVSAVPRPRGGGRRRRPPPWPACATPPCPAAELPLGEPGGPGTGWCWGPQTEPARAPPSSLVRSCCPLSRRLYPSTGSGGLSAALALPSEPSQVQPPSSPPFLPSSTRCWVGDGVDPWAVVTLIGSGRSATVPVRALHSLDHR